jgi:hypothetical protein
MHGQTWKESAADPAPRPISSACEMLRATEGGLMDGRCAVIYAVALAAAPGCGGGSARPDAPPSDTDAAPVPTPIMIRVFPDLVPSFSGRTDNASLVAFQDGDGPWVELTGAGGIYNATATGKRYAVAVGCSAPAAPSSPGVTLYYQSVSDMTEVLANGCRTPLPTVRLTVEVPDLDQDQTAEAWLGNRFSIAVPGLAADIDHPRGSADLFVRGFTTANPAGLAKLYRGPTIDLPADKTLQVNINSVGAPPEVHPLTLTGLDPQDTTFVLSSYATPRSELQQFPLDSTTATSAPDSYITIDASQRQPDDVSSVTASVTGPLVGGQRVQRIVRVAMKTPTALALQLPPVWTAPAPTLDRSAVPRATFTIVFMTPTLAISDYLASFNTSTPRRLLSAVVRQGYALGGPSVTITTPDLSSLPGWGPTMALAPGVPVNWTLLWGDRNMPRETPAVDGRRSADSAIIGQFAP